MAKAERRTLHIDGCTIPIQIYRESRPNVRFSIGKRAAVLRMPWLMMRREQQRQIKAFEEWVATQLATKKTLRARFENTTYQNGQQLQVGSRNYSIQIEYEDRKTHSGRLHDNIIQLRISKSDTPENVNKSIGKLLSRVVAQDFLPDITSRVIEINEKHYGHPIQSVKLKYNHSNWGSCSAKGNLNFSTRLLFAPPEVIDYVIIHELAHFDEMNHSSRFWKIVSDVMPDYKEKEKWLKEHGHLCYF